MWKLPKAKSKVMTKQQVKSKGLTRAVTAAPLFSLSIENPLNLKAEFI